MKNIKLIVQIDGEISVIAAMSAAEIIDLMHPNEERSVKDFAIGVMADRLTGD